jgi:cobalt/nickel transport system permease protein
MLKDWLGHQHSSHHSPVHRLPAAAKLWTALALIVGTVLAPWEWRAWFIGMVVLLSLAALLSRIAIGFLIRRLLLLSPFVLGVILVNAVQAGGHGNGLALAARSGLCLFTVVLLANTTPFGKVLGALRSARVPALLVTTLALMHRYLFVLLDESERMRRARASRTFKRQHRMRWQLLGTVVGQLFVRASERAERIYAAMCARGWK